MTTTSEPSWDSETVWEVHKFGGTSVANAECFLRAASIVEEQQQLSPDIQICVVVSAMGGKPKVTDLLLGTVDAASKRRLDDVDVTMNLIMENLKRMQNNLQKNTFWATEFRCKKVFWYCDCCMLYSKTENTSKKFTKKS